MKIGDKCFWKPVKEFPSSIDCIVEILEFDKTFLKPFVKVKWSNGFISWVFLNTLVEIDV